MNLPLLFEFSVDKENKTIQVKREFAAGLDLVWSAWTKPELLDRWWAPRPYKAITKSMDFREGGIWLYGMIDPEGVAHWCRADYQKIDPLKSFSAIDAFCDQNGTITDSFPHSLWQNSFTENAKNTTSVNVLITYDDLTNLEKIIEMGFKEGFTMALGNLDEYFEAQLKSNQKH
jgi:uncharacterized protein YndB with AHSA1/START domain